MEIQKPNLFDYATSELSQDAFLCWLFEYGTENNNGDEVYNVARNFLKKIFSKAISKQLPIGKEFNETVEISSVKKQYKNIDVLIKLSNGINIIIEDKTFTQLHDNQLEKYKKSLIEEDKNREGKIIKVYLKTSDFVNEETTADVTINREDIIGIIEETATKKPINLILSDYYNHLTSMQNKKNEWEEKKGCINNWNASEWIGYLEKEVLSGLNNHYSSSIGNVPNRGGGFLGCWWSEIGQEAPYIYRQMEINSTKRIRLAFKIENKSKEKYNKAIVEKLQYIINKENSLYKKFKNGNKKGKYSSFSYLDIDLDPKKGNITLESFEKEHLKPFKEFKMDALYKAVKETN